MSKRMGSQVLIVILILIGIVCLECRMQTTARTTPWLTRTARVDRLQRRIHRVYIEEFKRLVNKTKHPIEHLSKIIAFGGEKTLAILEIDPNRSKLDGENKNKRRNVNNIFIRDCILFDTVKRDIEAAGFLRQMAQLNDAEYHPIYMDYMTLVDVNELCRLLDFERLRASAKQQLQAPSQSQMSLTQLIFSSLYDFRNFILPGTFWCGRGDKANNYWEVGPLAEVDLCCREHDHCPVRMEAGETNYGLTNSKAITVSLCECEHRFRDCLLTSQSDIGGKLSWIYFNLLQGGCLRQIDCHNHKHSHNHQQVPQQTWPFANQNDNNKCNQLRFTIDTDKSLVVV